MGMGPDATESRSLVPAGQQESGQLPTTALSVLGTLAAVGLAAWLGAEADRRHLANEAKEQSAVFTSLLGLELPEDEAEYVNMSIAQTILGIPSRREEKVRDIYEGLALETTSSNPEDLTEMQSVFAALQEVALGFAQRMHVALAEVGDNVQDFRNSRAARHIGKRINGHENDMPQDVRTLATQLRTVFGILVHNPNLTDTQQTALGRTARGAVASFNRARQGNSGTSSNQTT